MLKSKIAMTSARYWSDLLTTWYKNVILISPPSSASFIWIVSGFSFFEGEDVTTTLLIHILH